MLRSTFTRSATATQSVALGLAARAFSTSSARQDLARFSAIGRIGNDLIKETSASGVDYLRYPLAVQTAKDETSWFKVVVFDPNAINFMTQYLKKGSQIFIEADASVQHYEADGQPRASLQLVQQTVNPISGFKKRAEGEAEPSE